MIGLVGSTRLPIPPIIVSSIEEFSLPCLLGQGVLIRTMTGDAAMVLIAEVASFSLVDFVDCLNVSKRPWNIRCFTQKMRILASGAWRDRNR